jgi:hypothetical protein
MTIVVVVMMIMLMMETVMTYIFRCLVSAFVCRFLEGLKVIYLHASRLSYPRNMKSALLPGRGKLQEGNYSLAGTLPSLHTGLHVARVLTLTPL